MIPHLLFTLSALLLVGCAGYSIEHRGTGKGYDVYRPEPYLLIVRARDSKGRDSSAASIVWLPDYGTRYRIDTWNVLGKADFAFELTDGWRLTGISDESDNTAFARELVDLATHVLESGTVALSETEPVALLRIVYDETGHVTGLAALPATLTLSDHRPPRPPR